jgi:hypothetical protein
MLARSGAASTRRRRGWHAGVMLKHWPGKALPSRRSWAVIAHAGHIHWFLGNLYEAMVDMPQLIADAQPNRQPGILAAGSPLRYYAPAAPVTLTATAATLIGNWRSGGDRRLIITAAASTASAAALTGYLVKTVNLRLLRDGTRLDPAGCRVLVRTWHRANLVRLLAVAISAQALHRAGQPADSAMGRSVT